MDREKVTIRKATPADLDSTVSCARLAYALYLDRMNREPAPMNADFAGQIEKGFVYVARKRKLFAGYVVFYPQAKDCVHLENLAVLPRMGGQGIGKMLIRFVENAARAKGFRAVELYTNIVMTENISLYKKLGYVETERKQQDGFDRVFFRKELK